MLIHVTLDNQVPGGPRPFLLTAQALSSTYLPSSAPSASHHHDVSPSPPFRRVPVSREAGKHKQIPMKPSFHSGSDPQAK